MFSIFCKYTQDLQNLKISNSKNNKDIKNRRF